MSIKFLYGLIAILAGVVCYSIAKRRGLEHPSLWFVAGVAFHVFAIAAVMYFAKYFNVKKKGVVS